MSEPENYTSAQASDPQTSGQDLADIAALRPDLRPAVAANPSAYPGLLEWLGGLGDPAVDAAIAARQPTAAASQQPQYQQGQGQAQYQRPQEQGQAQYQQPQEQGQAQYQRPQEQGQPQYQQGQQGQQGQPQYQQPQGQPQYQQPQGQPQYQQPQYQQPSSGPTTSLPPQGQYASSGPSAASYGQVPPGGYGYGYGQGAPPPAKKHTVLWVVLGVVGLLIVLGVVAVLLIGNAVRGAINENGNYGSDNALDQLWDRCEDGDWQACDDLYWDSPMGSEYEEFGDTCGNRTAGEMTCVAELGGGTSTSEGDTTSQSVSGGEPSTYGDDAYLDGLWDACDGGDVEACNDLYWESPLGSEYEAFADARR